MSRSHDAPGRQARQPRYNDADLGSHAWHGRAEREDRHASLREVAQERLPAWLRPPVLA